MWGRGAQTHLASGCGDATINLPDVAAWVHGDRLRKIVRALREGTHSES